MELTPGKVLAALAGFACGFALVYSAAEASPALSYPRALASAEAHEGFMTVTGCHRAGPARYLCREVATRVSDEGENLALKFECESTVKERGHEIHWRLLRCRLLALTGTVEFGSVETPNEGSK